MIGSLGENIYRRGYAKGLAIALTKDMLAEGYTPEFARCVLSELSRVDFDFVMQEIANRKDC